jgi:hypothetical protein
MATILGVRYSIREEGHGLKEPYIKESYEEEGRKENKAIWVPMYEPL